MDHALDYKEAALLTITVFDGARKVHRSVIAGGLLKGATTLFDPFAA